MFEVGKDILKHEYSSGGANTKCGKRLRWIHIFFCACFITFAAYTVTYVIQGTSRVRPSDGGAAWMVNRADIIDRNGDILAKNVMSGHITLRPQLVKDRDAVAQLVHEILPYEYSVQDVLQILNSSRRFVYIKKYVSDSQRKRVLSENLPGLDIESVQARKYPKRRLFSHVVGFVGNDGNGLEGAERIYDDYLRDNGEPLQLSLDARIQSVFYEQLSAAMQRYQAKNAMGMLMNSRTGEMIAMVSLPDFDPENVGFDPASNRLFKPMRATFEMGSIFKVFNTAMAMENGISKEYYVKEPFKIRDKFGRVAATISDIRSFRPPRPNLSVEEIMLRSCNVGSAQIALDLPDGTQPEFFHRIHLDEALNLEFGKTEKPLTPRKWGPVERATVSFGHGISVTPMHLFLAVNSMTNGGMYIYPTIQKKSFGPLRGERVLSDEISSRLRGIMFRIAEETSGQKARIEGIQIGGKTATAEKRVNGKIDKFKNLTAFVGIFPVAAPQYTIMVILDEPKGTNETAGWRTAAWNAVPTTGKILDSILPLLFE
ncbi:MAG: penicillin-binding protein 2 [Alphaproteobacteria bacterium]|nr:penicillin-binding protein 2 [Alphaproteobacteria bacterium]